MKTIGIITNFNKSQAVDLLTKVVEFSEELGFNVWVQCSRAAVKISEQCCEVEQFTVKGVEAVVVLGGDGTPRRYFAHGRVAFGRGRGFQAEGCGAVEEFSRGYQNFSNRFAQSEASGGGLQPNNDYRQRSPGV